MGGPLAGLRSGDRLARGVFGGRRLANDSEVERQERVRDVILEFKRRCDLFKKYGDTPRCDLKQHRGRLEDRQGRQPDARKTSCGPLRRVLVYGSLASDFSSL